MTTLTTNPIFISIKKVALAVFNLKSSMGNIDTLSTTNKTSIVAALNELAERPVATGGITEEAARTIAQSELSKLVDGADSALDTFREVGEKIKAGDSAAKTLLGEVGEVKTRLSSLEAVSASFDNLPVVIDRILTTGAENV